MRGSPRSPVRSIGACPRAYQVNDQYVRTWLTRHPELFTQSDPERFKLASLDVDILCGLATSWMPGEASAAVGSVQSSRAASPSNGCGNASPPKSPNSCAARAPSQSVDSLAPVRALHRARLSGRRHRPESAALHAPADGLISLRDTDEPHNGDLMDSSAPQRRRAVHPSGISASAACRARAIKNMACRAV